MVAPKVVTALVDTAVIEKTDWTDANSVNRFFSNIGRTMTSGQVWANIAVGYFHLGEVAKARKDNAPPDITGPFNAYRSAVEKRLGDGKDPKVWTEKTAETYRSVARTLAEIGYSLPYEGKTLIKYFAENGGGIAYGSRAKLFRNIAENFKTEPTTEDIEKFVKLLMPDVVNLSDDIAPIETSMLRVINAHAGLIVGDDSLEELSFNLKAAMDAFVQRAKLVQPPTPKQTTRGKPLTAEQMALKAKHEARTAPTTH